MANKKNKVKFNICNVHYAIKNVAADGTISFGTPVAMPGAVSLSLDANGEPSNFYADGYAYYTISNNMGYEGESVGKGNEEDSDLDLFSLEMFENIAYIMAKHADANIPDTPEEWLDYFNTFSIYQILPQLIELWGLNVQTQVQSKKTSSD